MNQEFGARMRRALQPDVLRIDPGMNVTLAHPDVHVLAAGYPSHVSTQEHVGKKQNLLVRRDGVDDLHRVSRGAAVIALRFHFRGGVHVRHDYSAGMLGFPVAQLLRVNRCRQ